MNRYTFRYAAWERATVTVKARDPITALSKAREEMDRRYEKANKEPPVAWSLEWIDTKVERCPVCGDEWSGTSCGADDCGWTK